MRSSPVKVIRALIKRFVGYNRGRPLSLRRPRPRSMSPLRRKPMSAGIWPPIDYRPISPWTAIVVSSLAVIAFIFTLRVGRWPRFSGKVEPFPGSGVGLKAFFGRLPKADDHSSGSIQMSSMSLGRHNSSAVRPFQCRRGRACL